MTKHPRALGPIEIRLIRPSNWIQVEHSLPSDDVGKVLRWMSHTGIGLVATLGRGATQTMGFAIYDPSPWSCQQREEKIPESSLLDVRLRYLWTVPQFRNQSVARRLVAEIRRKATARSAGVQAWIPDTRIDVARCLARCGFVATGLVSWPDAPAGTPDMWQLTYPFASGD